MFKNVIISFIFWRFTSQCLGLLIFLERKAVFFRKEHQGVTASPSHLQGETTLSGLAELELSRGQEVNKGFTSLNVATALSDSHRCHGCSSGIWGKASAETAEFCIISVFFVQVLYAKNCPMSIDKGFMKTCHFWQIWRNWRKIFNLGVFTDGVHFQFHHKNLQRKKNIFLFKMIFVKHNGGGLYIQLISWTFSKVFKDVVLMVLFRKRNPRVGPKVHTGQFKGFVSNV